MTAMADPDTITAPGPGTGAHKPSGTARFRKPEPTAFFLVLIGAFKLFKATIAIICGLVTLHLVQRDIPLADFAEKILTYIKIDPDNRHIAHLLAPLEGITNGQLSLVTLVFFVYAALFLVEGIGLVLRKRWGEWVAVVVSSLLIPYEVYETVRAVTYVKCGILTVNVAIVLFLIYCLRRHK
jgi:uncharacterized membrane protein (DUF2068 family)